MTHMKINLCIMVLLFSVVCLLPSQSLAAESSGHPFPIGEVIHIMGFVSAAPPGSEPRKLELKSPVFRNETIVTGKTGNVEIRFTDATVYSQGAESTLSLDDYIFSEDASISKLLFTMGKGTFRFVTGQIVKQNPEAFTLTTPMTSIGIRGTEPFAIIENQRESIGVFDIDTEHTVVVTSEINSVSMSEAGLMTIIEPGRPLSPPFPIPAEVRDKVIKVAPMTNLGEYGPYSSKSDLNLKVDGFESLLNAEKNQIGGLNIRPDYDQLRRIAVLERGLSNAESERDGKTQADTSLGGNENTGVSGGGVDGGPTGGPTSP
nr:FecR domain-containing protein [uncultured Pseudodesulfovibrio sp.]